MKIVVTGGLGFVGHSLVRNLLLEGHEVHALGRTVNPPKDKLVKGLHYHSHDLSKQKVAAQWFKGTDTVFHVAAKAGVGARYKTYRQANLIATEYLLQACQEFGVSKFIYTSTPSVAFSTKPIRGVMNPCLILERFFPLCIDQGIGRTIGPCGTQPRWYANHCIATSLNLGRRRPPFTSPSDIEASCGQIKDCRRGQKHGRSHSSGQCGSCPPLCFSLDGFPG